MSSFKTNYRQDPRMGFETRKKGKYKGVEKFVTKIKEIQKETKVILGKAQEKMKKYANRKRAEVDEYKVRDLVMLSTKDLKYQIVRRRTEKLTERFCRILQDKENCMIKHSGIKTTNRRI